MKPEILRKKIDKIDWSFLGANTKTMSHNIHRYSGKYIPQIAGAAMELISNEGDLILDPYVGSGTTLVEANIRNRRSIGVDLNPLAILLSQVKSNPINKKQIKNLLDHFSLYISSIRTSENDQHPLTPPSTTTSDLQKIIKAHPFYNDEWFNKWFNKPILAKLILLHTEITKYEDKGSSKVALVAFSNILRKCSNAHSGYPNVMFDRNRTNTSDALTLFKKELEQICDSLQNQKEIWTDNPAEVIRGDAKSLPLENESVDAIVTHPPYIGSVPYAEYGLLSIKWLGEDPKELDKILTGGRRQSANVVERFEKDYSKMIKESYRVLKKNRYMFILIGHPRVKGEVINLSDMTEKLAIEAGFKTIIRKVRKGVNRRANKMGDEDLLFFIK